MKNLLRLSFIGSILAIFIASSLIFVSCDNDATHSESDGTKDEHVQQQDQDMKQGQDVKRESSQIETVESKTEKKVFTIPDKMPEYPGGKDALMEYLKNNIAYPAQAREDRVEGKVYISFTIQTNGKVSNVFVARGIGGGCDEEAARVVSEMPNWSPGYENDEAVEVEYHLPINFALK